MIAACTRRLRRSAKLTALVPLTAALALASASPAAHASGTAQAKNPTKCPPGWVIINPKMPASKQICGRKVG